MKSLTGLLLLVFSASVLAEPDSDGVVRLEGISIEGNREEPHVLYIMPWQEPPGTGRLSLPINSYRDHWLQPMDRDSLDRERRYSERHSGRINP